MNLVPHLERRHHAACSEYLKASGKATGVLAPDTCSSRQVTLKTEFCRMQLLPGSSNRVGAQFIDNLP